MGLAGSSLAQRAMTVAANRCCPRICASSGGHALTAGGLMTVVNFAIRSDFRWALLAASGLWVVAIAAAVWS